MSPLPAPSTDLTHGATQTPHHDSNAATYHVTRTYDGVFLISTNKINVPGSEPQALSSLF